VRRSGGTDSLRLIGDAIAKVQMGMDRTAAELAIRRLRQDLAEVEAEKGRFETIAAVEPSMRAPLRSSTKSPVIMKS
jgi:hypothetical protein